MSCNPVHWSVSPGDAGTSPDDLLLVLQDNNPEAAVTNLIAVLRRSPQPDSRTFCAVLLRKV